MSKTKGLLLCNIASDAILTATQMEMAKKVFGENGFEITHPHDVIQGFDVNCDPRLLLRAFNKVLADDCKVVIITENAGDWPMGDLVLNLAKLLSIPIKRLSVYVDRDCKWIASERLVNSTIV